MYHMSTEIGEGMDELCERGKVNTNMTDDRKENKKCISTCYTNYLLTLRFFRHIEIDIVLKN